jgi:predicted ATP-dependent Lon-type protease
MSSPNASLGSGRRAASVPLLGRAHFGGALSDRDQNAVNKTVSGPLKLLYPNPEINAPDEDLEWAVKLGLEMCRPVKEQQKRIGSAEFRNTQFSYSMGLDGIEHFVSTPELQSEGSIGGDPLPPGQVFAIGGRAAVSGFSTKRRRPRFAKASGSLSKTSTHERAISSATATRASTSSSFSCDPSTQARVGRISAWPC